MCKWFLGGDNVCKLIVKFYDKVSINTKNNRKNLMPGFGFDIASSNKIPENEKNLISTVEEWLFRNGAFTRRQRSPLDIRYSNKVQ